MKTTRMPFSPCWSCGSPNDAATDLEDEATPKPGDLSFCAKCAAPAVFSEGLTTREPTEAELDEILQNEEAVLHIVAIMLMRGGAIPLVIVDDDLSSDPGYRMV